MGGSANQGALTETVFYILLRLHHPAHGYALMKDIGEMTDHRVSPGAGTLYGALETLQKKGWVTPLEGRRDGGSSSATSRDWKSCWKTHAS